MVDNDDHRTAVLERVMSYKQLFTAVIPTAKEKGWKMLRKTSRDLGMVFKSGRMASADSRRVMKNPRIAVRWCFLRRALSMQLKKTWGGRERIPQRFVSFQEKVKVNLSPGYHPK